MTKDRFDFVIFGATGYTGAFVIERMITVSGEHTWAVAGRSEEKLQQALAQVSRKTGISLINVPILVADVSNPESIAAMARRAKVILNTVGPFRWYGEPVVKACIENGTDHVDISGEPTYLENMALKYHEDARKHGVYVVGSCGGIPNDLGVQYAIREFDGQLDAIETVADFSNPKGTKIHYGTFQTMVYIIAHRHELEAIRRAQGATPLPKSKQKQRKRSTLCWHEGANGWCIPYMGANASVINRTMQYNYKNRRWRPVQVKTYMKAPNIFMAIGAMIWGMFFFMMSSCKCGRWLLLKNPKLFSGGMFSHEGPSQEQIDAATFRTWVFGTGWNERRMEPDEQSPDPPKDKITCTLDGPEYGYTATAAFLVAAAFTILEERENLPDSGGVLTTGAAFATTHIYERLTSWGLPFKKLN